MKHQLLFVEDQEDLGSVVKQYLEVMDFEVDWCTNGVEALKCFRANKEKYHLLILDIQLPEMDGFDIAEIVVKENNTVPFLFLTARNEKQDRIRGLKIGADDYISKPFDVDELVLRIKNIIRRQHPMELVQEEASGDVAIGDIVIQKDRFRFTVDGGKPTTLTVRELELLQYLCKLPNKVLKREDILMQLWGENDYFLGRSLDVFISRLRKQLQKSKLISIDNVYGVGFIFNVK